MTFARVAQNCWIVSAQLLRWRADEFWSATPIEFLTASPDCSAGVSFADFVELRSVFPDEGA